MFIFRSLYLLWGTVEEAEFFLLCSNVSDWVVNPCSNVAFSKSWMNFQDNSPKLNPLCCKYHLQRLASGCSQCGYSDVQISKESKFISEIKASDH